MTTADAPAPPVRYRVVRAPTGYRPWWAQRAAASLERAPDVLIIAVIAARQSGKSQHVLFRLLRRAAARAGGESLALWPSYKHALPLIKLLQRMAKPLGGVWHEQKKCMVLRNGHTVWIRSADDDDATRGMFEIATLVIDEAALVSEDAFTSALATISAARDPLVLVVTTPRGKKNWVYRTWRDAAAGKRAEVRRILFRTLDSPYVRRDVVTTTGATMGAARKAQEFLAQFTDDAASPFPPEVLDRVFARPLEIRGSSFWIGVDLAKEKDYTVLVLMNEYGEAWIIGRWRKIDWTDTVPRIINLANDYGALVVVDEGHGGGYGGAVADFLVGGVGSDVRGLGKARVMRVRTGNPGVKAEVLELLVGDCEHDVVRVDNAGPFAKDARHEMLFFTSDREVVAGVERIVYRGPQGEDEHDDCVIALALANFGRVKNAAYGSATRGDFTGFAPDSDGAPAADGTWIPLEEAGGDLGGWDALS